MNLIEIDEKHYYNESNNIQISTKSYMNACKLDDNEYNASALRY